MSKAEFMNELRNEELEKVTGGTDVKGNFVLILHEAGPSRVDVVRVVKEMKDLGIKEAKELVEAAPVIFGEYTSEAQAIADKYQLEDVGCKVEIVQ